MVEKYVDICILGGGASGMVAAIKAKETNPEASLVILEKLPELGHKVAASGNGRCNLSNIESPEWEKTSAFFSSIGLVTRTDSEGRVYPYSEDGRDVVFLLKRTCLKLGVDIICRREAKNVELANKNGYSFLVSTEFKKPKAYRRGERTIEEGILKGALEDEEIVFFAKKILISTGGKSKPKLGTTGDGFRFAKSLGHSVTHLIPVLTGVETKEVFSDLAGVRQKGRITLKRNNEEIFSQYGEIQFTDYGISGICVFDMTRFLEGKDYSKYEIVIDFVPEFSSDTLNLMMENKEDLCSFVKAPLGRVLMKKSEEDAVDIIDETKSFRLHPNNLRGWDMAQVTRGGVPLSEINPETGESILVPGLFFSGEVMDIDYRCGGFNLQNAWTTGIKAGIAMGESITSR